MYIIYIYICAYNLHIFTLTDVLFALYCSTRSASETEAPRQAAAREIEKREEQRRRRKAFFRPWSLAVN